MMNICHAHDPVRRLFVCTQLQGVNTWTDVRPCHRQPLRTMHDQLHWWFYNHCERLSSWRHERPRQPGPRRLMSGYIDLHAHLLPGIDDGPGDLDGALA